MYHERFMSGEFHLCDPLDVDVIVVAPKPERPYDMTGGQVFDALEKDARARFENRRGHVARCDKDVQVVDTGAIYPFGEYGSHVDGWRKVEE